VTLHHNIIVEVVFGGHFGIATARYEWMEIDESLFILPVEISMICDRYLIDPLAAVTEGSRTDGTSISTENEILF
jgi:hydrogenase maturation factor